MVTKDKVPISRKVATLWNFLFLNIQFVVAIVNGILIVPLYLHYIDSSIYGAWLATGNILNWITIVDPGVSGVLLQRVAHALGKDDHEEAGLAITSGIGVSLILFIIAILVGYGLSFFIGSIANIDDKYQTDIISAFRIALMGTAFSLLADTFRNIVLAFQKTKLHGMWLNAIVISAIGVNVMLLVMGFGVYALAYTSFYRGAVILIFAVITSLKLIKQNKVRIKFDWTYFKSFSKVFSFTFSSRLFNTIASNIDLILVSRFLGSQYVTMLDLCRRPVKIVSGMANSVTQSMLPTLAHLFGHGDHEKIKEVILKIWLLVLWISIFVIGGFLIFGRSLIHNWVGDKFWIGNTNNIVMCVSFLLLSIGYNLSNITYSMGDIRNNSIIEIVKNIIYIVFLYFFSKYWGMLGVLIAFALPNLISTWYFPRKVVEIAKFSKNQNQNIINEHLVLGVFFSCCIIIPSILEVNLDFKRLAAYGVLYCVIFGALLFASSKLFKEQLLAAVRKSLKYNK